jgi:hypothetical protein
MRMMGRLSQRNWTEIVAIGFKTPLSGEIKVALQARPGSGPMAWWLMLSESGTEGLKSIGEVSEGEAFATEAEFAMVASAAVAGVGRPLDLSVFRTEVLTGALATGMGLSPTRSAELDQKIGATLQDSAAGGVVARPEPGHYALVHEKDMSAQAIAGRITETAAEAGVPAEQLGLSHRTMPVPTDADREAMQDLLRHMRQNLTGRSERKPSGGFMERVKSLVGIG